MYQAYKNIDREKLEDVNIESMFPRGQGRTFSYVLQMLGEAWLGDAGNQYLYIGERADYAKRIMRDFYEILRDEGFEVNPEPGKGKLTVTAPNSVTFYFIGPDPYNIERMTRGSRWAAAFVDLTSELEDRARRELEILHITMEHYHDGSSSH